MHVLKDPSSPMDVCPFCGKAFKRLKSHLPHCKMTETKKATSGSDPEDQSRKTTQVAMKKTGTTVPNVNKQDMTTKEKSKTGLKNQVRQDKTIPSSRMKAPKVGKITSGNRLNLEEAAVTMKESKKDLQTSTRTSQMVTIPKVPDQQLVALAEPNVPIQKALLLRSNIERTVPMTMESPRLGETETVRDQVSTKSFEGDVARFSALDRISEKDNVETSGGTHPHDQNIVPRFSSGSTKALMIFKWSTTVPHEGVTPKLPGSSPTECDIKAEMHNIKALGTTKKSAEIKVAVLFPPKTAQIVNGPLGLQWVPHLYPNYVQLRIVPGKQDQWDLHGRGSKPPDLIDHSKITRTESILENQSKSKRLMDVRIGELPLWLANHRFTPKNFPTFMTNVWGRYYNKYINVKKGGVGGVTMLLAGYCVLSYSWNYDHIRQNRWRKYH
ncbi:mitochondrial nucleoid-associated protein 1 isoform 2-T2 [Anomaloglossus baeobatrachus]|uniref:mitochondrial nucleoid-associated protein 1 isoform X2 n=1 Tax=Anomaloglossus baeobatrachus TaxID=238106 RepID=UPI003F4FB254